MTFSVLFTFTDFQLIYVLTRGGPLNATHLMATLSFQRAIPGGSGRRGGDRDRDDPVPARGDPVLVLRPAAPRLAAGRSNDRRVAEATRACAGRRHADREGMNYLDRCRAGW